MTSKSKLEEQASRHGRVEAKEEKLVQLLGYEELFKTISCILCDYDKELIYNKVLSDIGEEGNL